MPTLRRSLFKECVGRRVDGMQSNNAPTQQIAVATSSLVSAAPAPPAAAPGAVGQPAKPWIQRVVWFRALRYAFTVGVWVAAAMSVTWWTIELLQLSKDRLYFPGKSNVIDDYAGIGIACAWLVIATVAIFALGATLLVTATVRRAHAWKQTVVFSTVLNVCLTVAGVSVAYAWTVSTLPAIGSAMRTHSPYLATVSLQHVAFSTAVTFSAVTLTWVYINLSHAQLMTEAVTAGGMAGSAASRFRGMSRV